MKIKKIKKAEKTKESLVKSKKPAKNKQVKKRIEKDKENELLKIFYQLIADIQKSEEAEKILPSLIPQSEIRAIAKRVYLAKLLEEKTSYSKIKEELGVSSATISQTAKWLKKSGLKLALVKVEADAWAEEWATKIKKLLK